VVTKERYKDLPDIFAYFIARVKEYKKIGVAQVTSAIPLSDAQKKRIEQRLLDTTSYETMEIDYKVDESKIGGLMIRIGDRVVDSTISSKLSHLTGSLMRISLESEKEGVQAS
jgi:F-type H+-transporting ATPase subunit delta